MKLQKESSTTRDYEYKKPPGDVSTPSIFSSQPSNTSNLLNLKLLSDLQEHVGEYEYYSK